MRKLICWLIRRRLGVKIGEPFRFINQKTMDVYRFGKDKLWKSSPEVINYLDTDTVKTCKFKWTTRPAGVSFNWLLDSECKVVTMSADEYVETILKEDD